MNNNISITKPNGVTRSKAAAVLLLLALVLLQVTQAKAQLNSFSAAYYQNQYLNNPAMAGLDKGLNLNLGISQQWTNIAGGPKTQVVSADYDAGRHVGLGLNVSDNTAGLIRQTRAIASYAYHVALRESNSQKLNFGLSIGINTQYINQNAVDGDQGDVQIDRFNSQNRVYLDGDFGLSYTSDRLTFQVTLPNLNHLFMRDNMVLGVDRSVFMTAVSYKFFLENLLDGSSVEPKLTLRGVDGYSSILNAGLNISLKGDLMHFYSMYHSSQNGSFGFGADISKNVQLMLFYTTEYTALKTYTNGNFELGLKLHFFNKQPY